MTLTTPIAMPFHAQAATDAGRRCDGYSDRLTERNLTSRCDIRALAEVVG